MEDLVKSIASFVALSVEAAAVVLITMGAIEAVFLTVVRLTFREGTRKVLHRKEIWVRFAIWLMLGLEFELAADIIRSAISPSWTDIGQLGAIAAIRTALNYFLEKDIGEFRERGGAAPS